MSSDNYYEILGVSESATQEEIKRAYRKKAVEHHPDKGGSEEVFKKIAVAYDCLGDENKRKEYDNRRNNPFQSFQGFQGFGGFDPFAEFFNNSFQQQRKKTPDKILDINVGVIESFVGTDKNITYIRNHGCNSCGGSGGERIACGTCRGTGHISVKQGTGMFVQISRHVCESCKGQGYTLAQRCFTCNGSGKVGNAIYKITS